MFDIKAQGQLELFGQEENVEIISIPEIEILYDGDIVGATRGKPSLESK